MCAVVAEHESGPTAAVRARLAAPERRRHRWAGEDSLLIGFPASPEGTPWDELPAPRQLELARAAGRGEARLDGEWTLVTHAGDELVVRTDPFGLQPLFLRARPGKVVVAEDIWPLLETRPSLDPVGIADFLILGYHLGSRTVFADVRQTTGGSRLRIAPEGITKDVTGPELPEPVEMTLDDAVEAMETALRGLFGRYRDTARLVVLLSGGLDSRVLAALAGEDGFDVHAWTFVLQRNSEEEEFARRVARELGLPHTVSYRTAADVRRAAREFVVGTSAQTSLEHLYANGSEQQLPASYPTAVNGIWGDVICGGGFLLPEGTAPADVEEVLIARMVGGREVDEMQRMLPEGWAARLRRLIDERYALAGCNPRLTDFVYLQDRPGRFNVWPPLAMKLEFVNPFLNRDLIRVCYAMPERWHRNSLAYRKLIVRRWPALGRIPWEKTGRRVDRDAGRLSHRIRDLRRWYGIGRPVSFVGRKAQLAAFGPLMADSLSRLRPTLAEVGVDVDALLKAYPDDSEPLRIRLVTLDLILQEAGLVDSSGTAAARA